MLLVPKWNVPNWDVFGTSPHGLSANHLRNRPIIGRFPRPSLCRRFKKF